jgi:hypothetical protein
MKRLGDKPTSHSNNFTFQRMFSSKQILAIDLSIESGYQEVESRSGEHRISYRKSNGEIPFVNFKNL